jgi:hypothetical protein
MPQLFTIPVALTIACVAFATRSATGDPKLLGIGLVVAAAFAALLFAPARSGPVARLAAETLTDAALVAATMLAVMIILPGFPLRLTASPQLIGAAFLLIFSTLAALQLCLAIHAGTRPILAMLMAVLVAAPIWLAPVVEATGNPAWLTNLAVAISPLSLIAVTVDVDLLRTPWFYENSAIGSLRYSYPSLPACLATLALLGGLLLFAASRGSRHP